MTRNSMKDSTSKMNEAAAVLQTVEENLDPMGSATSPRVASIDMLKGAAIIGVVVAHLVIIQNRDDMVSSYSIGELFYSALSMFIVLSGYFYNPEKSTLYYLRTRILPLFVTFVVFTVVLTVLMYGYLLLLGYDLSSTDLWGDIGQMLIGKGLFQDLHVYPGSEGILAVYEVTHPYYFLQILIGGYLIFYPLARYVLDDWRKTLAAVVALTMVTGIYMEYVHIQLPFLVQLAPITAAMILIGAFMGKHKVADYLENGYREKRYWVYFGAVIILAIVSIAVIPTKMSLIYSCFGEYGGWSALPFLVTSMSCGMVLFFVVALASHVRVVAAPLIAVGLECGYVFLLHVFVAKLLVAPFIQLNTDVWIPIESTLQGIVLVILTISIIMGAIYLLRYLKSAVGKSRASPQPE